MGLGVLELALLFDVGVLGGSCLAKLAAQVCIGRVVVHFDQSFC